MSITFWIPDAPTKNVINIVDRGFEVGEWTEVVSTLPELNVSNVNASILFEVLKFEFDDCGTWDHQTLPGIKARINDTINDILWFEIPDCILQYPYDVRERIRQRLESLDDVVSAAIANGYSVSWG